MNKNNVGRNSLIFSITMLILFEYLIYIQYLQNEYWKILSFGFEAATIGGLADWFAVSALFKEIPIPFIKKHTNIIVKNREKISDAIIDLVTNKWLSINIIKDKLYTLDIAAYLFEFIDNLENKNKIIFEFKKGITDILSRKKDNIFSNEILKILNEQLRKVNYSTPLAKWLYKLIEKKEHHIIFNHLINKADKKLQEKDTVEFLDTLVKEKIEVYKKETFIKGMAVKFISKTGFVDSDIIVKKIIISLQTYLDEIKEDKNHPLRLNFESKLLEWIKDIEHQKKDTSDFINKIKDSLFNIEELKEIFKPTLEQIKINTLNSLNEKGSSLDLLIKKNIDELIFNLKKTTSFHDKINNTTIQTLESLIEKYHKEIGNLIATSLAKLNDKELVKQIESKVGNDLQYIRLNGAIVGGLIGLVFSFIRIKLL